MRRFLNSIYFKVGIIIVIVEVVILTMIGTIYLNRFFTQIDQRVLERSQLLGDLITANLVRIVSINDPQAMRLLVGEEIVDAFLASPEQTVFYSHDLTLVGEDVQSIAFTNVGWFDVNNPREIVEKVSDAEGSYIINVEPVSLGTNNSDSIDFFLYTRINTTEAEAEKRNLVILLAAGTLVTIVSTSIIIIVAFNFTLLQRIQNLAGIMRQVEEGDLSVQLTGHIGDDELGTLERGANSMIVRLNDLFETLEQRVANRTRDLKLAADMSRRITTVLDIDTLLGQVVIEANKAFDLNYSSVFLLRGDKLVRVSEADAKGKNVPDVVQSYNLTDRPSVVAEAARTLKAVYVSDIRHDTDNLYRASILDTRSELAIPMLLGSKVIGVLDVQSTRVDHFQTDEIQVLTTLAEQIAVAVRNAELFSALQLAKNEAEQANRVKSQFLAAMSHELRTPLNGIMNFTGVVADGMVGDVNEKQEKFLKDAVNNAEHLLSLINDVLDISKIEAGALKLFIEDDVNVAEICRSVVNTGEALLKEKPVTLTTDIADDLPLITCDARRVRQILLNILSNACKFTKEGSITVGAKLQNREILLWVRDTGPGIAAEDHGAVFETFLQTETGLRNGGGTGLGMPISRKLAEAHGGSLWIESEIGQGTTFFVTLPIHFEELQLQLV